MRTRQILLPLGLLLSVSIPVTSPVPIAAAAEWTEYAKLTAGDAAAGDLFGLYVAISGNTAIVGAPMDGDWNDDGGKNSGSAYLFDVTTGSQFLKLTASDAEERDEFGHSVAVSGNTAIVGAYADDDGGNNSGSAYVFSINSGEQLHKLTAGDAAMAGFFGFSVAISGNAAIVGAHRDDDGGNMSGSVYLFDVSTGNQLQKLTASDPEIGDAFGWPVAISGNKAIIGAYLDDHEAGSAYLYTVPEPSALILSMGAVGLLAYGWRRNR